MIRYLIDTDISSYFLKKRYPSLDRRMRAALMANAVALSAITRAELRYGQALLPSDAAKRHALIDAFIAEAPVLDWGSRAPTLTVRSLPTCAAGVCRSAAWTPRSRPMPWRKG